MSLDLALGIARSGLDAAQRGLAQASQNIGNAETPGYTRKSIVRVAQVADALPAGVRVAEAQRAVDAALVTRLDTARASGAAAELRERLIGRVEQAHGEPGEGASLAEAVSALEDGFLGLRASPADTGLQREGVERAETLARRLNGLSDAISGARQEAQDTVEREVATINATLREIASLTVRIKAGRDGEIAELEDLRDGAIGRLAESLEVKALRQPTGDVVLLARGIAVLPLEPDRDQFSVAAASLAPAAAYDPPDGTVPGVALNGLDVTRRLAGGRLGEALMLRDQLLPRLQAEADLTAATLAGRLEAQGLRLFTEPGGGVPDIAAPYAGSDQVGFAGRISVNAEVAAAPQLLRDGTHDVPDTPDGPTAFAPNGPGGPAGFTTLLDRVLDFGFGAEAAAGVPWPGIATSGLGPDGQLASPFIAPATIGGYAARVTTAAAADRAEATRMREEAATLTGVLEERFRRETGADIDAELAGMIALQNAYAANARVIGTVQAMWDSLLGSVR